MYQKTFKMKSFKSDDVTGTFSAVFATMGVIDLQDDRIMIGAIGNQEVIISAYGHTSWYGVLPVGKGRVREQGNEAIVDGKFILDTQSGKDTYTIVKNMDTLQEWSFSLQNTEYRYVEEEGRHLREITKVEINEVCPVLKGAGINTRLLNVKDNPFEVKFGDRIKQVIRDVENIVKQAKENKDLSDEDRKNNKQQLTKLKDTISEILSEITETQDDKNMKVEIDEIFTKFEELLRCSRN